MRLFEAILAANRRALAGDATAGLHPAEFADALPVAALTCIDVRLNALLPAVLGLRAEDFIWLRNAGNIITGPLSSTLRSLALACAVKGAREIVILGHSNCRVCQTPMADLLERFRALGIERSRLPENLTEYFGLFASERQNVLKAVEFVRHSPLIGARIPVHGLLVDLATGQLEWLVDGYAALVAAESLRAAPTAASALEAAPVVRAPAETRIGAGNPLAEKWLPQVELMVPAASAAPAPITTAPPRLAASSPGIPLPPPLRRALKSR